MVPIGFVDDHGWDCTNNAANKGVCVLHSYESGPESDPAEDELLAGVGGQFVNGLVRSLGEHRQVREVDSFGAVRADKVPFAPPNHADGTRTRSPHRRSARKSPKGRPRRCPPETIRRRMRLSWNEIRVRTVSFARKWADAGYEKGDTLVGPREFVVEITWKAINFMLPDESKLRFPKSLSGFLTDKGVRFAPPSPRRELPTHTGSATRSTGNRAASRPSTAAGSAW